MTGGSPAASREAPRQSIVEQQGPTQVQACSTCAWKQGLRWSAQGFSAEEAGEGVGRPRPSGGPWAIRPRIVMGLRGGAEVFFGVGAGGCEPMLRLCRDGPARFETLNACSSCTPAFAQFREQNAHSGTNLRTTLLVSLRAQIGGRSTHRGVLNPTLERPFRRISQRVRLLGVLILWGRF